MNLTVNQQTFILIAYEALNAVTDEIHFQVQGVISEKLWEAFNALSDLEEMIR